MSELDREQIRRHAQERSRDTLARHCLALLAELEQAERMIDRLQEGWDQAKDEWDVALYRAEAAESKLAKVPALVEAAQQVFAAAGRGTLVGNPRPLHVLGDALAAWNNENQGGQ